MALAILSGCITEEREQTIGDALAAEINPRLPLIDDPLVDAYVYGVGEQLAAVSARPDLDYRFHVVDTDVVNAFALPGGHIYVTRGLIARTHDAAEFAGVLAHEIGHVAARHGVKKLQRQLRTGSLVGILYRTILGGEPEILRANSLQLATAVWSARNSRSDEKEADRLAVTYLIRTGAPPGALISLFRRLLAEERAESPKRGALEDWFATHPLTTSRIANVQRNIDRLTHDEQQMTTLETGYFDEFRDRVMQSSSDEPTSHGS